MRLRPTAAPLRCQVLQTFSLQQGCSSWLHNCCASIHLSGAVTFLDISWAKTTKVTATTNWEGGGVLGLISLYWGHLGLAWNTVPDLQSTRRLLCVRGCPKPNNVCINYDSTANDLLNLFSKCFIRLWIYACNCFKRK